LETIKQWHTTDIIVENDIVLFQKKYKPDCYELKNELSWLTSNFLKSCITFETPNIVSASIKKGILKMDYIETKKVPSKNEVLELLINIAVELHSIIKTTQPILRVDTKALDYNEYVVNFVLYRVNLIKEKWKIRKDVATWIINNIQNLSTEYFTIVHRDLRYRHLSFVKHLKVRL